MNFNVWKDATFKRRNFRTQVEALERKEENLQRKENEVEKLKMTFLNLLINKWPN